MKQIIRWLEAKLSRQESPNPSDVPSDSEGAKPDEDEYVDTVPNLKILDESPPDTDNSTGFNPYDTAKMNKK